MTRYYGCLISMEHYRSTMKY